MLRVERPLCPSCHRPLPRAGRPVTKLGRAIAAKRAELGWTQTQVGAAIGMSKATVCRVETSHASPNIRDGLRLARWLGVPLEELVDLEVPA